MHVADIKVGDTFRLINEMFGDLHMKEGKVTSVFKYKHPTSQRSHEIEIDFGTGRDHPFTYPSKFLRRL